MTYLNLIPAILVIGAYFLGRYVGRHSHDAELTRLRADNTRLATMLDFTQAECEHAAGLLKSKVANAHRFAGFESLGEIQYEMPVTDYDGVPPSAWTQICSECGAFNTHAIGCKSGRGWIV